MSEGRTNGAGAPREPSADGGSRDDGEVRTAGEHVDPAVADRIANGAVVVTGICGRLGRRLARQLHRDRPVIGLDRREFSDRPKDIEHHKIDVRRKKTQSVFRGSNIAALVHLGVMHNPRGGSEEHHTWNVAGFQKLLDYVKRYDVPKVVLISSSNVYGPRPDNAQFLTEDTPLLAAGAFSDMRDLVELDMLAQSFFWKHPQTETVILRPTHILGTVKNAPSNYLRLKVVPTLMGFDPMVQVVHQDDVVRAIQLALRPGVRGIFNIAGPDPLPLSSALSTLARATMPLPHPVAKFGLERLWRLRMTLVSRARARLHPRTLCMVGRYPGPSGAELQPPARHREHAARRRRRALGMKRLAVCAALALAGCPSPTADPGPPGARGEHRPPAGSAGRSRRPRGRGAGRRGRSSRHVAAAPAGRRSRGHAAGGGPAVARAEPARPVGGRRRGAPVRRAAVALALAVGMACSSRRAAPPPGPPPEYERSPVTPWDAGLPQDEVDPFAEAAEGDWVDEPETPAEAGAPAPPAPAPASDGGASLPQDGGVG